MSPVNSDDKIRTTVDIFGTTYKLVGTQSQAYMHQIAAYVNENMSAIAKSNPRLDTQKVSVLALISMADEYFQLRAKWDAMQDERSQAQLRIEELRKTLELTEEKEQSKASELERLRQLVQKLQNENVKAAEEEELASLAWAERAAEWEEKYNLAVRKAEEERAELFARVHQLEEERQRIEAAASSQSREGEKAQAAPAQTITDDIQSSDLPLLEKYNKLQEEYAKLRNEFNEWIELTQMGTQ